MANINHCTVYWIMGYWLYKQCCKTTWSVLWSGLIFPTNLTGHEYLNNSDNYKEGNKAGQFRLQIFLRTAHLIGLRISARTNYPMCKLGAKSHRMVFGAGLGEELRSRLWTLLRECFKIGQDKRTSFEGSCMSGIPRQHAANKYTSCIKITILWNYALDRKGIQWEIMNI